ncbi:HAD family hydrolase [Persicimonas caeni]|uniref:HAD family hydrolase n=1 Tax=Persicimonas caeni TaxID=2292766 RepID=A0A4Y6PTY8_PERCE|nr:HAD family hydrolase [Persicimonas caeni]QDG51710.1 HAD family hydrolase [Persicimonas caeni]QED32931.1 HAD family hydrolase [Persicimonas caeni]
MVDIAHRILRSPAPKVVSFDVFDTLLRRQASTSTVDRLTVRQLHASLERVAEVPLDLEALLDHRRAFARRHEAIARKTGVEWSVEDWLDELAVEWALDRETVQALGLEAQSYWEKCLTAAMPGASTAIELLEEHDISVVAISDTYLPKCLLDELLHHHDLPIDRVFSSASIGLSKRHGQLFEYVVRDIGISPHQLVHVGDNLKSDVIRAAGSACRYIWVPRTTLAPGPPPYVPPLATVDRGLSAHEVAELVVIPEAEKETDALYRFGKRYIAPVLCLFSYWQWRHYRRHGISHSFYLAREGRLLLDVYEKLADVLPDSPQRHYAHLSRRAVSGALLLDLCRHDAGFPGKIGRNSARQLLEQYPLDDSLCAKILAKAGIAPHTPLSQATRAEISAACSSLRADMDGICAEHRQLLAGYLRDFVGDSPLETIALVDSGWAGTTQRAINQSLDGTTIVGLYLGVSAQGPASTPQNLKFGLLRDDHRTRPSTVPLFKSAGVIRAWELILSNPAEPTTIGLRQADSGRIEPLLGERVPLSPSLRSSRASLTCGVLDGVEALKPSVEILVELSDCLDEKSVVIAARLLARRALCFPPREAAEKLLDFRFHEGAVTSTWSSLDLGGLPQGVAWLPGILAKYRLSALQGPLDTAAFIADRLFR